MIKRFVDGFKINAFFTILSRLSGFIRDVFFAFFLGAGVHSDIFFIASKIPNVFRRITAEGAFTSSFLPVYSELINSDNKSLAYHFSKIIFIILFFFTIFLTIILYVFAEELVQIIAPGFLNQPLVLFDIITLTRITIFFLPLISLVSLFGAMLNAKGKFAPFAFSPVILNICIIFSCLFVSEKFNIKFENLSFENGLYVGIRPEDISLENKSELSVEISVDLVENLGSEKIIYSHLNESNIKKLTGCKMHKSCLNQYVRFKYNVEELVEEYFINSAVLKLTPYILESNLQYIFFMTEKLPIFSYPIIALN